MNTLSKLTMYPFQTLAIRSGLRKATTNIAVTKQSHIMSGLRSLFFIQIILTSACQNQIMTQNRVANRQTKPRRP
jgi:hypothetical protein